MNTNSISTKIRKLSGNNAALNGAANMRPSKLKEISDEKVNNLLKE